MSNKELSGTTTESSGMYTLGESVSDVLALSARPGSLTTNGASVSSTASVSSAGWSLGKASSVEGFLLAGTISAGVAACTTASAFPSTALVTGPSPLALLSVRTSLMIFLIEKWSPFATRGLVNASNTSMSISSLLIRPAR